MEDDDWLAAPVRSMVGTLRTILEDAEEAAAAAVMSSSAAAPNRCCSMVAPSELNTPEMDTKKNCNR